MKHSNNVLNVISSVTHTDFFPTNVGLPWQSILFFLKHHRKQKWCSPTVTWFFFYISTERQHQCSTNHFVSHTLSKVRMAKRLGRRRSCCAIGKEAAPSWKAVPWFKRRALWQDLSNNQKTNCFQTDCCIEISFLTMFRMFTLLSTYEYTIFFSFFW